MHFIWLNVTGEFFQIGVLRWTSIFSSIELHFGVNSGAARFAIEHQAVNEATFRCPDEMGWKPQLVALLRE
ncbi:hypothetical protein Ancab_006561 [Ancistrocladus abbreviatus]